MRTSPVSGYGFRVPASPRNDAAGLASIYLPFLGAGAAFLTIGLLCRLMATRVSAVAARCAALLAVGPAAPSGLGIAGAAAGAANASTAETKNACFRIRSLLKSVETDRKRSQSRRRGLGRAELRLGLSGSRPYACSSRRSPDTGPKLSSR